MAKVLLVDDAPVGLALERSFLTRTGSAVLVTGTRSGIVSAARSHHPDLILFSSLPGPTEATALASCRAIKAERDLRATPVILLGTAMDAARFLAAGGDGVASRPLTSGRLVELVRRFAPVIEREHDRAPITVRVQYRSGGRPGLAYTRDLGPGGLFVHTGGSCADGEVVELVLRLPVGLEREVRASGRVVRTEEAARNGAGVAGVGIRFERLSAGDRVEIGRFVREHAREAS